MKKNFLLIGGKSWSIINFRGSLIKELIKSGYDVTAVASNANDEEIKKIKDLGANYINLDLDTNLVNIYSDIKYFFNLIKIIRELKPKIILSYTMKPIVYTGLALFFSKRTVYMPLITGLGNIFNTKKFFRLPLKYILIFLCKISLKKARVIIFQNKDNLESFKNLKIAQSAEYQIIEGSGVDIDYFEKADFREKKFSFLLISRLILDKGVVEYIEAAKKIKAKFSNVEFLLAGPEDHSNNSVDFNYVQKSCDQKIIKYLGFLSDVRPIIRASHVYVLPSYHEGLPRSILEAMSMGRPIITTLVPGCKETVINNINGFLVPKANVGALVERMAWFINNKKYVKKMGNESRNLVEQKFSNKIINFNFIKLIKKSV